MVEDTKKGPAKRNDTDREQTVAELRHRTPRLLSELLGGIELRSATPSLELSVRQVANDSRKVAPGALFVAVQGVRYHVSVSHDGGRRGDGLAVQDDAAGQNGVFLCQ